MFDSLDTLLARLKKIENILDGTQFAYSESRRKGDGKRIIVINEPNGNLIIAEEAPLDAKYVLSSYGSHYNGFGNAVGIKSIVFYCKPGTSERIARFYEKFFGADIEVGQLDVESAQLDKFIIQDDLLHPVKREHESNQGSKCSVIYAKLPSISEEHYQTIIYSEASHARPENAYDLDVVRCGFHICIYVRNYEESTRLAFNSNLMWTNPRFSGPPLFDKVKTEQGALQSQQYRLKDVPHFVLEHEVRGIGHNQCPLHSLRESGKPVAPFGRVICKNQQQEQPNDKQVKSKM